MRRTRYGLFRKLYGELSNAALDSVGSSSVGRGTPSVHHKNDLWLKSLRCFGICFVVLVVATTVVATISLKVQAAPTKPDVDAATAPQPETETATPEEIERAQKLDWSLPKRSADLQGESMSAREFFYHYRKSTSIMVGPIYRTDALQDPKTLLTLTYWRFPTDGVSLETGVDLLSDGVGGFHVSKKENLGRGELRNYYKYGAGVRIIPSEQLVTFLKLQNWQVRGGIGSEWQLPWSTAWSLRGELGLVLSQGGIQVPIGAGATASF